MYGTGRPFAGFSRRQRLLLLVCAHLVALAYLFQIMAVDHWHADPAEVLGIPDSQMHIAHCHGASSGCADSAGFVGSLAEVDLLPAAPMPRLAVLKAEAPVPGSAAVLPAAEPPRAA